MPGRTAILVVNGFDRIGLWGTTFDPAEALRYPWIDLCLREVERRSAGAGHEIFVWDNSQLPELRSIIRARGAHLFPTDLEVERERGLDLRHSTSLHRLLEQVGPDYEYVVTLDTDAFPIRDGWLDVLQANLERTSLTGVWRDEMAEHLSPFVHPSCLAMRRERLLAIHRPFALDGVQDAGQWITDDVLESGEGIMPLRRSNARNAHFLIGGIYGDLVYHHAAGSRKPLFRLTAGLDRDAFVYTRLRDELFKDSDHVIAVLRGEVDDDLGLDWTAVQPESRVEWTGLGPRDFEYGESVEQR